MTRLSTDSVNQTSGGQDLYPRITGAGGRGSMWEEAV